MVDFAFTRSARAGDDGSRRLFVATAALLAVSLTLGGAGAGYPLAEAAIELAATVLLAGLSLRPPRFLPSRAARPMLWWAALVVALPLVQLVPLPPGWWQALPSRALVAGIDRAAGLDSPWRPLSLAPDATRAAARALLPPVAVLLATLHLPVARRVVLLRWLVAAGLGSTVLGALQFATNGAFTPWATAHRGYPVGLFVNRNHQAVLLLCGIALAGSVARSRAGDRALAIAAMLLMALGVVATSSRMGLLLLPPALGLGLLPLWWGRRRERLAVGVAVVGAATGLVIGHSFIALRALHRLDALADDRLGFWRATLPLVRRFGAWGAGLGAFPALFPLGEPLESVRAFTVNHAHNDALELLLDGGAPAAGLLLLVLGWLAAQSIRDPRARACCGGVLLLLLASTVDYPLRMTSLSVTLALLLGAAAPPPVAMAPRRPAPAVVILAPVLAGVIAWQVVAGGLAARWEARGQPWPAMRAAPWAAAPAAMAAAQRLAAGDAEGAEGLARRSLRAQAVNPVAVRVLGLARAPFGARADALARAAAALGWRDLPTQLWMIDRALAVGDARVAAERTDAVLRQRRFEPRLFALMAGLAAEPGGRAAIAERVAARPPWRGDFLAWLATLPPARLPVVLALVARLRAGAAPPARAEIAPLLRRLVADGNLAAAARLAGLPTVATLRLDFGEVGEAPADPFAWRAPPLLGVTLAHADGGVVEIATDGLAGGTALARLLPVVPGRYRLSGRALAAATPAPLAVWRVACAGRDALPLVALPIGGPADRWRDRSASLLVPRGCAAVALALRIEATGAPASVRLDPPTLARMNQPDRMNMNPK